MNNYIVTEVFTFNSSLYCKLLTVLPKTYYGVSSSSGNFITLKIYQITDNVKIEKVVLITNNTNLTFYDLTPNETRITLKYKDNVLYLKGYAELQCYVDVIECDSIGSFKKEYYPKFNITIDNTYNELKELDNKTYLKKYNFTYVNNWVDNSSTEKTEIIYTSNYASLSLFTKGGTTTNGTIIITLDKKPKINISFPLFIYNGNEVKAQGYCTINSNGEVKIYGILESVNYIRGYVNYIY